MGVSTVGKVTRETCLALWEELNNDMMPEPTEETWEQVTKDFWEKTVSKLYRISGWKACPRQKTT